MPRVATRCWIVLGLTVLVTASAMAAPSAARAQAGLSGVARRNHLPLDPRLSARGRELMLQLRSRLPRAREVAARSLAFHHEPGVERALARVLAEDCAPYVRAAAAVSLGMLGLESSLPALARASVDPDPSVARAARLSLEAIARGERYSPYPVTPRRHSMIVIPTR